MPEVEHLTAEAPPAEARTLARVRAVLLGLLALACLGTLMEPLLLERYVVLD